MLRQPPSPSIGESIGDIKRRGSCHSSAKAGECRHGLCVPARRCELERAVARAQVRGEGVCPGEDQQLEVRRPARGERVTPGCGRGKIVPSLRVEA